MEHPPAVLHDLLAAGARQRSRQLAPQVEHVRAAGHLPAGQHHAAGGGNHALQNSVQRAGGGRHGADGRLLAVHLGRGGRHRVLRQVAEPRSTFAAAARA